jgi:hypothetical protein
MTAVADVRTSSYVRTQRVRPSGGGTEQALGDNWTPPTGRGSLIALITPACATNLLTLVGHQRPRMKRLVDRIANDIEAGRWVYDGSPIVFDTNRNLINGQHRIAAIAQGTVPVVARVEWGVHPDAFAVMDGGVIRQNRDVLSVEGHANTGALSMTLKMIGRWDDKKGLKNRLYGVTNAEMVQLSSKHPEAAGCVEFVYASRDIKRLQSPSVTSFLLWLFRRIDPIAADQFFTDVGLGANLPVGDARFAYRRYLDNTKDRTYSNANQVPVLVACGIKAWNSWRAGEAVSLLRHRPTLEDFPLPQ